MLFNTIIITLSAPARYDQRQDGKVNVHAKLENFLIVLAPSTASDASSVSSGLDYVVPGIFDALELRKNLIVKEDMANNEKKQLQEVILPDNEEFEKLLKETRTLESEKSTKKIFERNTESKLLGDGIENCGPGRHRDSFGICQIDSSFKH